MTRTARSITTLDLSAYDRCVEFCQLTGGEKTLYAQPGEVSNYRFRRLVELGALIPDADSLFDVKAQAYRIGTL